MSAQPVDVLAVLDAAVGQANGVALDHSGSAVLAKHRDDMREARAAVAELVEAARDGLAVLATLNTELGLNDEELARSNRLHAALARMEPQA